MKDKNTEKLERLKLIIKNTDFISVIDKKIDKIKNNKTINKDGN
jgi:hypothetical protein|tara:strand:- start:3343 stop:3474 length:132 start_codon:yes stop_codon:yes gene_type:complete